MVHSAMFMIARLPSASAWDWLDSFRMGRGLLADLPIANFNRLGVSFSGPGIESISNISVSNSKQAYNQ
ncbi:hypothetical protein CY34DRAFT_696242 [Suillus luteus UH-Slu-Lm8-n1]|uniref:Uncharacterized protein n=1 Tax=Suillus luteus UH-Slu-Lm8-n1 TaxID=930992 RepID=A0A0D0BBF6_9AGAM|nr:hypothetical protein CY34DRAFT_696242 [Suillus luteus UH-Slu-Lm8-n1]